MTRSKPMGKRHKNQRGVTLVTALITGTLLALAGLTLSRLFVNFSKIGARTDVSVKGDEVLVRTAGAVSSLHFSRLVRLCEELGGFQAEVPPQCTDQGVYSPQRPVATLGADDPLLGVGLDWDANPVDGGQVCIELAKCERRASGFLLDIVLRGSWSTDQTKIAVRSLTLRRTRW